jgi:exonuclease VII large subunit
MLNVYLPKKVSSGVHLEPGNKIRLYGMFNLQENLADNMDFIKFDASRVLNSSISESKKETILNELNEKGFLEKPKKKLHFDQLDFFNLLVISSKDSSAFGEIKKCLGDEDFFKTTVHYIDLYKADKIAETIKSLDKNCYYDAILITGVSPKEASLFDEISVLTAIHECNTLVITAMGNTLANEISDITEDGPVSAAKMLLYQYKEKKFKEMEKPKKEEFVSSAYDCLLSEKNEADRKLNTLLKENSSLIAKIGTQQKLITILGVLSFITVIIAIIK